MTPSIIHTVGTSSDMSILVNNIIAQSQISFKHKFKSNCCISNTTQSYKHMLHIDITKITEPELDNVI